MVTCQSANQLKTPAKVSWAFKMISQAAFTLQVLMHKSDLLTISDLLRCTCIISNISSAVHSMSAQCKEGEMSAVSRVADVVESLISSLFLLHYGSTEASRLKDPAKQHLVSKEPEESFQKMPNSFSEWRIRERVEDSQDQASLFSQLWEFFRLFSAQSADLYKDIRTLHDQCREPVCLQCLICYVLILPSQTDVFGSRLNRSESLCCYGCDGEVLLCQRSFWW